jgi:hypothetical protein
VSRIQRKSAKVIRPAAAFCLLFSTWTSAHHGIANFDLNQDIEVSGVVTDIEFINPHSWVYIDVTETDGSVTQWRCELRGASVLRRSGWREEMFPTGMEIRVTGSPDRRDPTTCYTGTVFFPDGSSIDRYGQIESRSESDAAPRAARRANGDPNLAGDWAPDQVVMTDRRGQAGTLVPLSVADQFEAGEVPGGGQGFPGSRGTELSFEDDPVAIYWNERPSSLPLTEAGEAVMAGLDLTTTDNPRFRCAPTSILFDWTFEQEVNRIEQTNTTVRLIYGSMGLDRTIHLGLEAHPDEIEPSIEGHSIGRWEGHTLVVDTTGFEPGLITVDSRLPHGENLHVVERFTLSEDARSLTREYTAEDPEHFVGRFSGGDVVLLSDLPYAGTAPCEDRTYRDGVPAGAGERSAEDDAWWMIWKWFD